MLAPRYRAATVREPVRRLTDLKPKNARASFLNRLVTIQAPVRRDHSGGKTELVSLSIHDQRRCAKLCRYTEPMVNDKFRCLASLDWPVRAILRKGRVLLPIVCLLSSLNIPAQNDRRHNYYSGMRNQVRRG